MPNYFNSYNPWAQLAVMGRTIGDSLAGEMYKQPQIKFELARQQQQDAQNDWYKQQQIKLAQEDNDRQLATSTLHNQGLQLNNDVLTRNAQIAGRVRQLGQQNAGQMLQQGMIGQAGQAPIMSPEENVYDLFGPKTTPTAALYRDLNGDSSAPQPLMLGQPTTGGPSIGALNAAQNASTQALGDEQAALRGQLAPALLGQQRQDNLMTLGAMRQDTANAALHQRMSDQEERRYVENRKLEIAQLLADAKITNDTTKLKQALENANYMKSVHTQNSNIFAANYEMSFAKQLSDAVAAKNQPLVDDLNKVKAGLDAKTNTAKRFTDASGKTFIYRGSAADPTKDTNPNNWTTE